MRRRGHRLRPLPMHATYPEAEIHSPARGEVPVNYEETNVLEQAHPCSGHERFAGNFGGDKIFEDRSRIERYF